MRIFVELSLPKGPWGLFHETPRRLLQGLGMPWGLLTLLLETRHRVFGSCKRSHPVEEVQHARTYGRHIKSMAIVGMGTLNTRGCIIIGNQQRT